jgi:hypothetical protein
VEMANIIYAIYKENVIPLVGGVNPEGIETGLAEYNNWKLCAMEETEFNKFSEFKLYPVPKSIAVGMVLANQEDYDGIQEDLDGEMPEEVKAEFKQKTAEEEKLAELAMDYLKKLDLKFITRAKVRQFKDFEDDLSDTKLLIEFLLAYIAEDYSTKTDAEKAAMPIKDLMESFLSSIENSDLRTNIDKILNKIPQIIKDESIISRIVKSNYIDKLKG